MRKYTTKDSNNKFFDEKITYLFCELSENAYLCTE